MPHSKHGTSLTEVIFARGRH